MRISSLSTRLVLAAIILSAVTVTAFVTLTLLRLNQSLERQSAALSRLSEYKLQQKLIGEARLAGARVEMLFERSARALESLAQRADIAKAVSSGNVVEISEVLGRASKLMDIDGILVVDAKTRVVGSSDADLGLVVTNRALQLHPIGKRITGLLADNDRKNPSVLREMLRMDAELAAALRAPRTADLAFVGLQPLFDDFGDVFAALIAHRGLRAAEPVLEDFSLLVGAGLMVLHDGAPISWAGVSNAAVGVQSVPDVSLLRTSDGAHWAQCTSTFVNWQTCAVTPVSELHTLRDQLGRIGETEGRSLANWLLLLAAVSILVFTGGTLVVARHIVKPLSRITQAVRAVARGDWKSDVMGSDRADEIGDIARAVIVLQRSLEERDRLRSNVAQAEEVKKRREMLEEAIRRFDRVMRSMMLSVSDTVETMDETARELARMSAVAEGEAVEAAFVSEHTVAKVSSLHGSMERLSASIAETADRIRQTTDMIGASSSVMELASTKADGLAHASNEIDRVVQAVEDVAARASALALKATVAAARTDLGEGAFTEIAGEMQALADQIHRANHDTISRVSVLRGMTDDTVASVGHVVQKLDFVLQQTRTIVMAMERQDAATREITENMSLAATGTMNVSASVDRLKTTIEDARGTSARVVAKATDMADEAHRLDSTVKTFLREVTA